MNTPTPQYPLENTQMSKNSPKCNQMPQEFMELVKDSQYKDIENCVRAAYSIFPDSTSRTIASLRDILEGTWVLASTMSLLLSISLRSFLRNVILQRYSK